MPNLTVLDLAEGEAFKWRAHNKAEWQFYTVVEFVSDDVVLVKCSHGNVDSFNPYAKVERT